MRLSILVTNTDRSAFAARHAPDGVKFAELVRLARPDWRLRAFDLPAGEWPGAIAEFDGALITGSPASVHCGAGWVAALCATIRDMAARRQKLFGACFGHQAIALALGGAVGRNPGGWVHGLVANRVIGRAPWMAGLPDPLHLYASHSEQVTALPPGARVLTRSEGAVISGMAIGAHVYTTQHHPEMDETFIRDLTEEMAPVLGPKITARARASFGRAADQRAFAESLARFFESGE